MKELVTEAIVLSNQNQNRLDRRVSLLTKDLGKIKARAISGYKINSKLSPHLDPLNLVEVRLVIKNNFIIADSLTKNRFKDIRKDLLKFKNALESIFLIESLTPQEIPDDDLWSKMIEGLEGGDVNKSDLLAILGYSPELSTCFKCGDKKTQHFLYEDQVFFCNNCYKKLVVSKSSPYYY